MSDSRYEYRGLIAATWDLLRGDTSRWADRFFYKEVSRRFRAARPGCRMRIYEVVRGEGVTGYRGFTFDPARPDDAIFTVVGCRPS